jgi:hypothetical protein
MNIPSGGEVMKIVAVIVSPRELGRELCRCIRDKRYFPDQEEFIAGFRQRMVEMVDYMQESWSFEHAFWQEKQAVR